MKLNSQYWENEFEDWMDDESPSFEKLTHKTKAVKRDKQSSIQKKKKEKEKERLQQKGKEE